MCEEKGLTYCEEYLPSGSATGRSDDLAGHNSNPKSNPKSNEIR